MGHTAKIFRSFNGSTRRTAVSSPRSTTLSVPCQTLSRQSAPRHPDVEGLGGSLKTWAFLTVRRILSISSSCGMLLSFLIFAGLVVEGGEWKRDGAGLGGGFGCV